MLGSLLYRETRRRLHPFLIVDDRRGLTSLLKGDRRRGRASLLDLYGRCVFASRQEWESRRVVIYPVEQ